MSSCNPPERSTTDAGRAERVRQVIENCLDRRAAGESVTDEELLANYPDFRPDLEDALGLMRLAANAEQDAANLAAVGLHVRCPHCQIPIEFVDERSISDLVCPSCGSQLSFADDSEKTFHVDCDEMINHFRLVELVGVGAFGGVWRAHDTQLDRTVALKVPRKGQMDPADQEQFIREARAAAQLRHPNIVRVLEVGQYKDRVYIASEFIEGLDLADWLTEHHPTPAEAATICLTVADALQHAHEQGVIHRDMKPSNIMLDGSGEPHLMDFGLAKREAAEVTMTMDGKLLGTPAYMSPEQARGDAHNADSRSDVYSLGVILFELLTGERPFRGNTRMLLQQVLLDDAPGLRKLDRSIPADIETICLKCLEKDPNRRYRSAKELRDDLRRFLNGQPVKARPITRSARAWRWCKRNPVISGLATTVACLMVLLTVTSVLFAVASEKSARDLQLQVAIQSLNNGNEECDEGYATKGIHFLAKALNQLPPDESELRFSITQNLREWSRHAIAPTNIFRHSKPVFNIEYSPDGSKLVSVAGNEVKVWSTESGALLHDLCGHKDSVFLFRFSPDSRRLITCGSETDRTARVWSLETGESIAVLEHEGGIRGAGFHSPENEVVSVTCKWMRLWSGDTFELLSKTEVDQQDNFCVKFSADCSLLLTTAEREMTNIWSVENAESVGGPTRRGSKLFAQEFSPDGSRLITGAGSGKVEMWSTTNGEQLWEKEHFDWVHNTTFDPTGRFVLTTSADGSARIWSAKDGEAITNPLQHGCPLRAGAFLPDGESFVTIDHKAFIRLWSTSTGKLLTRPLRFDDYADPGFTKVAVRPDGKRLAICSFIPEIIELDLSVLQPSAPLCKLKYRVDGPSNTKAVAFSTDARKAITGTWDGTLMLWSLENGKPLGTPLEYDGTWNVFANPTQPHALVQNHDALRVVSFADDQLVELCELSGRDTAACAAFSPDGSLVITRGVNGHTARVWSTKDWKEVIAPVPFAPGLMRADFSPDGNLVVALCHDGTIQFWSPRTGQFDGQPLRHSESNVDTESNDIVFSADGRFVASGGVNKRVTIWDVETRTSTGIVLRHDSPVSRIRFTPDSRRILTATQNGDIYMWSALTGERIGPLVFERDDYGASVALDSRRNKFIISADDGAELWALPRIQKGPIPHPLKWANRLTGRQMSASGTLEWLDQRSWLESRQKSN